jgi:uncharacterized protein (TIGR02118 family)
MSDVVTRIGMAPRAAGMSYEALQAHWRSGHADVAAQLPGLRAYVQLPAVLAGGRPLLPYAGFDACSELDFDDAEAMEAAFASEHYRTTVTADEHAMIDRTRGGFALTRRRVLAEGDGGPGGVLLLTFLRVHPRSALERLDEVLAGSYRDVVAQSGALGHVQLIAIPEAHGAVPPAYDAVDELAFAHAEEALAYVTSDLAHRAAWELGGIGQGGDRLIARPTPVVARSS